MLHSVPRYNNPTGVFDNDQYLLDIVGKKDTNTYLKGEVNELIDACNINCEGVEDYTVTECSFTVPVILP